MGNRIRLAAGLLAAMMVILTGTVHAASAVPDTENTGSSGEWKEVLDTIHHDEEGHFENRKTGEIEVTDKAAWDENVKHWFYECTVCLFRTEDVVEINDHLGEHPTGSGYHYYDPVDGDEIYPSYRDNYEIIVIHHDAETHMEDVYEDVWVVDQEAYDEDVHTGVYKYFVDGRPAENIVLTIDGTPYYFDSEGTAFTQGFIEDNGRKYYFDGKELVKNKRVEINGGMYSFDADGAAVTGWKVLNGRKYYFADERCRTFKESERGKMVTGWAAIGNRTYYFADDRYQAYSKAKEGIMLSGWKTISGRKYYFLDSFCSNYKESNKGSLLTGFRSIRGKTYYLTDDRAAGYRDWKRGILLSGPVTIGGKRYFLTKTGVVVKDQVVTLSGKKYYFGRSGVLLTNRRVRAGGRWYFANEKGERTVCK